MALGLTPVLPNPGCRRHSKSSLGMADLSCFSILRALWLMRSCSDFIPQTSRSTNMRSSRTLASFWASETSFGRLATRLAKKTLGKSGKRRSVPSMMILLRWREPSEKYFSAY